MSLPSHSLTLIAAIGACAGISMTVWLAFALPARIAPRASLLMACANGTVMVSLVFRLMRSTHPGGALIGWTGDVLAVASAALLGMAVTAITRRRVPWRRVCATVAAVALVLLIAPGDDLRWPVRIVHGAGACLMLAAGIGAWRQLSVDTKLGDRLTPAPLALPIFLLAILMAVRCAASFVLPPEHLDMHRPTPFNIALLWGGVVALLMQNATLAFLVLMRLIRRIERLLERDPLTDTLNRSAFHQALNHAHAWFRRDRGYALVMIDMDRFKQLNDTLGHAAGDAALRQMVAVVQPCLREVDRFGRLGGEEFCVLLPDTNIAGAALVAERMRTLIHAEPLRWLEQDWPLSASFGIAEAAATDTRGDEVLARADQALYRAKHLGRNLVQA
ncbi:sensor domain-containing diguanylate cyclase [Roseateles cellulosilyticus]|uniref:diguanylate cyclase n=1 Tax=Pelomonas cellulosilytica TaxID=2906762 RepID=A0ABS8XXL6_9BURK|nr:GGDEF domain-containing protein [Pelomonas sp. P8]MCE4557389.1 GGDEF domain-containing protein [Pelomonas sp. P8]